MMTRSTTKTMLTDTLATMVMSWKNRHTQWVRGQMTQSFLTRLMAIWKTLMHPHLTCMHQTARRNLKKTRELLSHVKSAKGYSPLAGIGASETCKVSRQRQERQEERIDFSVRRFHILVHLESCQKLPSRSEPPPPDVQEADRNRHSSWWTTSCSSASILFRQYWHRASECPNKGEATYLSPDTRALGTCAQGGAVLVAMCDGADSLATVEEPKDLVAFSIKDLEDVVAVSIESLEGFAILTEEPRRLFLDPRVFNQ